MIKSIGFKNFKGFTDLSLDDLKMITLISGMNNAGKSSVLDGLFLFMDHTSPDVFQKLNLFRGIMNQPLFPRIWEVLFKGMDVNQEMSISIDDGELVTLRYSKDTMYTPANSDFPENLANAFINAAKKDYSLKFSYTREKYNEKGHFIVSPNGFSVNIHTNLPNNEKRPDTYTRYINHITSSNESDIISQFSQLDLENKKSYIIDILKTIDPRIKDIKVLSPNGFNQLYISIEEDVLPLKLAGDGMCRLLSIILGVMTAKQGLVLIDEIETGFHYTRYPYIWKAIYQAAKSSEAQVIATTHSYECIQGSTEGIVDDEAFAYIRLDREVANVKAKYYSRLLLKAALDADVEVR